MSFGQAVEVLLRSAIDFHQVIAYVLEIGRNPIQTFVDRHLSMVRRSRLITAN